MLKKKITTGVVAGILAFGLAAPTVASAAPTSVHTSSSKVAVVSDEAHLASSLQTLFEEVLVIDEQGGFVSYDETAATKLLGADEARSLGRQIGLAQIQARSGKLPAQTLAANDFVGCMVENSVIGLVSGVVSGSFAELIREKKWDELAKKLWPKLVKAGVTGGVVGVAAGLAASAVQCTFFE